MKGTADDNDDDLKLAFPGSNAARGMGVVAFSVAGNSVGGAGHGRNGALPQGFGPECGGSTCRSTNWSACEFTASIRKRPITRPQDPENSSRPSTSRRHPL